MMHRERINLCSYLLDGYDTDGTAWYWCQVHDELAIGNETACAKAASMEGRAYVCHC